MKKILALLLLAAAPLFAGQPEREVFPSDYQPLPCAPEAKAICKTFPKENFLEFGRQFRGFSLERKWIDAHWDEMEAAFLPLCGKIASCYAVPGNDAPFCIDLMRPAFEATCDRFEAGTPDHDQCSMFATTWFIGLGVKSDLLRKAQSCATATPAAEMRRLEAWTVPSTIEPGFDGVLHVYAIDAETKVPVRARVSIDSPGSLRSTEGPVPTAGYGLKWDARLKRVPNAAGHSDVVAPEMKVEAKGYEPLTVPLVMPIGKMIVEMSPRADQLKKGKNVVTITARDAESGQPVEARVMGGEQILGETNKPFELTLKKRGTYPEIWLISLFDRYSDVVVVPAKSR